LQQKVGLVPLGGGGTFLLKYYPVVFKPWDFVLVTLIVCGIALLGSLIPAVRASREGRLSVNHG